MTRKTRKINKLTVYALLSWIILIILALTFTIFREIGFITITVVSTTGGYIFGRIHGKKKHRAYLITTENSANTGQSQLPEWNILPVTRNTSNRPPAITHNLLNDPRSGVHKLFPEE